ncbi:MAG: membrane protein insertase YidC, partial [Muribaculaceae bacterium]|nr:membrane protein insertase YidC [Muribaculaceae bacterium]
VNNTYSNNGALAAKMNGAGEIVTLENDSLKIEVSTKGAQITRATLKGYTAAVNTPLVEVISPEDNEYGFTLIGKRNEAYNTKDYAFDIVEKTDSSVTMVLNLDGGAKWGLKYTLTPKDYMVRMEMLQEKMEAFTPSNITYINFEWNQKMMRHEAGKMFEDRNSTIYYKLANSGDVDYLNEMSESDKQTQDHLKWISTKNQFFSAVLIADKYFSGLTTLRSTPYDKSTATYQKYLKDLSITSSIDYSSADTHPASFYFYLGPNRYKVLRAMDKYSPNEDLHLTRLIPLGWKLFRWINTGIIIPIFNWLGTFISNYGIIILLLTIIIKLILSPLTLKSYMSQAKMRILNPDIKEINEKYPGQENAMKRQQKTMALYKQAGASPFGGCLPMLLQMPILIAMFTFFPSCIELRGQSFLWAADLSAPDAIVSWDAQIPFISGTFGNHISLFCMLMTVTNIVYTYLTMQSQQSSSMPGMKWMMYLMPIFFLVFFNNYASGLSYYYFISLLITIAQTYACRAYVKEDKVRATMAANAAKQSTKKKSGWMARLEEAQKRQQQLLKEREQRKGNNKRR